MTKKVGVDQMSTVIMDQWTKRKNHGWHETFGQSQQRAVLQNERPNTGGCFVTRIEKNKGYRGMGMRVFGLKLDNRRFDQPLKYTTKNNKKSSIFEGQRQGKIIKTISVDQMCHSSKPRRMKEKKSALVFGICTAAERKSVAKRLNKNEMRT